MVLAKLEGLQRIEHGFNALPAFAGDTFRQNSGVRYLRRMTSTGIPQMPTPLERAIFSSAEYSKGASGSAIAQPLCSIQALRSSLPTRQLALIPPSGYVARGMQ